ncbi:MAG: hypothetical protein EB127_00195 [Alphaproteobacteria bacterium]|nr:hypothetical protein [Alphaproteobacteria bacterium]
MANRIHNTYNIYIDSYISDINKEQENFPEKSQFHTYSNFNVYTQRSDYEEAYWSLRKNRAEIPLSMYRNGILDPEALKSYVYDGKLYVMPGEYSLRGDVNYLSYQNVLDYSTNNVDDTYLSAGLYTANVPRINYLTTGVYKRGSKASRIIATPKDQANVNVPILPDTYIGYDFDESISEVIVNNFIQKSANAQITINPRGNSNDRTDQELGLIGEFLGTADGSLSQVFNTKYFPISLPGDARNDFTDQLTRIYVKSSNGSITFYQVFESYLEALQGGGNSCYVDRYKGKVFFARKSVEADIQINDVNISSGDSYTVLSIPKEYGSLFDDYGYVQITNVEVGYSDIVFFNKIDNKKIQISQTSNSYNDAIISITAHNPLNVPVGMIYAFYTTVIGFQSEIATASRKLLSEELTPWLWSNQKTIAVLNKDRVYPYSISLKAVDVPFIKKNGTTMFYGPLHSGAEIVFLEGEVLSDQGEPVANQDVTIFIKEGVGLLNGENEITLTSNDEGKFYVSFNPVTSRTNFLYFTDNDVRVSNGKTYLSVNPAYNDLSKNSLGKSEPESAIVYGVFKDDGSLGTVGKKYTYNPDEVAGSVASDFVGKVFSLSYRYSKVGNYGILFYDFLKDNQILQYTKGRVTIKATVTDQPDPVYKTLRIKDIVNYPEAFWNPGSESYEFLDQRQRNSTYAIIIEQDDEYLLTDIISIQSFWILSESDIDYSALNFNGRKVIFAEEKGTDWKHPNVQSHTPVYGPVMTNYYTSAGKQYTIPTVLPMPSSSDRDVILAGYALIPDKEAMIQAKAISEDEIVYSNTVGFEIELNERDKGVVENTLKTIKVPYGFRFYDTQSDASSTIGTETFLTVNALPGTSLTDPKYPVISYLTSNGIIYMDNVAYQHSSTSVNFTIESV